MRSAGLSGVFDGPPCLEDVRDEPAEQSPERPHALSGEDIGWIVDTEVHPAEPDWEGDEDGQIRA